MKGAEAGERKYFLLDVKTALRDIPKAISSYLMLLTPLSSRLIWLNSQL
jgi:hypothetical protein